MNDKHIIYTDGKCEPWQVTRAQRTSEGRWKLGGSQRDNETNSSQEVEQEVDLLILADLMTALPGKTPASR